MSAPPKDKKESRWTVPLAGFRGFKRADLPREVSAGVTLMLWAMPYGTGLLVGAAAGMAAGAIAEARAERKP